MQWQSRPRFLRTVVGGRETVAISIITLGEFAEVFTDPRALVEFLAPFRVVTLSRAIAWRTARGALITITEKCSPLRGRLGNAHFCFAIQNPRSTWRDAKSHVCRRARD
jgi:hypothetical protein